MKLSCCNCYAVSVVSILLLTVVLFFFGNPSFLPAFHGQIFTRATGATFAKIYGRTYDQHMYSTWSSFDPNVEVVSCVNRHIGGEMLDPLFTSTTRHDRDHTAVILLKVPRSGSSWATELLNQFPDVYLSKEIVQSNHIKNFDNKAVIQHLSRALQTPTDKLGHCNMFYDLIFRFQPPSGRFWSDYILNRKFLNQLNLIGFTINPLHFPEANYHELLRSDPKIILLVRSNIAKLVVSDIRGRQLHLKCQTSNLQVDSTCTIGETLHISILEFVRLFIFHSYRMLDVTRLAYDLNVNILEVTYEDLQKDSIALTSFVRNFLLDEEQPDTQSSSSSSSESHWVKRTGEDLSSVVTNYEEIETFVISEFGKDSCIYRQLDSKVAFSHSPCYYHFPRLQELYLELGGNLACLETHWCFD